MLVITGPLGTGKTRLLQDFQRVAQREGRRIGRADHRCKSLVQVLRSLAAQIKTPHFDAALEEYISEFQAMGNKPWIEAISSVAPSLMGFVSQASGIPPWLKIALAGGSVVLTQEVIEAAALQILSTVRKREEHVLMQQPLAYLNNKFKHDLISSQGENRVVFLLDDFELLAPFLRDWLPSLIQGVEGVVWIIACWGEIPDWLKADEIWPIDRFSDNELLQIKSSLTSSELAEVQGPPIFGLPILAVKRLQGQVSHRGLWWPMIEHMEWWLRAQFGDSIAQVMQDLRRCSIARYLDSDVVKRVTGSTERWEWIYTGPLLVERNLVGQKRSSFDIPTRSILTHDLYRQSEREYYDLHNKLQEHYQDLAFSRWHHRVERWYHEWCVLTPQDIVGKALNTIFSNADEENIWRDVGQLLEDVGIEREETRDLRRWGLLLRETGAALLTDPPRWVDTWEFYKRIDEEIMNLLREESRLEVWFGRGMAAMELAFYDIAIEAFENYLSVVPEDEEAQQRLTLARNLLAETGLSS